jgi:adenine-specific DNA-methyltransferase
LADELDVLLDKVDDPTLRAELRAAVDKVRAKRTFGLVFESHLPERVTLPDHPIRRGARVTLRNEKRGDLMKVVRVRSGKVTVTLPDGAESEMAADELVVVAEFGEAIYPGLQSVGSIRRGGDKPAHVVINAENHHALEMLQFTHAGKVDCIYIDPPYNTGAKDWKYDNNYVDAEDGYRHSKWLAFMERRLLLAKHLLNPDDSVLVVTIDEHEVHRLRMLLEQVFPAAYVQMITIVVNPKGVAQGRFARVEEYAIYCFLGSAGVLPTEDDYLSDSATQRNTRFWKGLLRAGTNALPSDGLGMVYPIFVGRDGTIAGVGRTLRERIDAGEVTDSPNTWLPPDDEAMPGDSVGVWPMRRTGQLGVWQAVPDTLLALAANGFTKCVLRSDGWAISYIPSGVRTKIEAGEIAVVGRDPAGSVVLERQLDLTRAKTVWKRARHDAGWHGAVVLRSLLGARVFDFPKSIYAVRDALAPILKRKRNAVVVDFFAGSGTTAHALALLNRSDDGHRVSISITNNEVSAGDVAHLARHGHRPGDPAWEQRGIFESVTQPRLTAALTGVRPDGVPVDLRYDDESDAMDGLDENLEFMKLTYLDPVDVELDRAFASVAPMLWMRAGSAGSMVTSRADAKGGPLPFAVADQYGVLFDPDRWRDFLETLPPDACVAYVVTDSAAVFAGVVENLPAHLEAVRLYENYLTTFAINQGWMS